MSNSKHYVKNAVLKEHSPIPVYAQCGLRLPLPLNDTVFSTCCFEFDHTRPICNQSLSYVADLLMIPYGYSTNLFKINQFIIQWENTCPKMVSQKGWQEVQVHDEGQIIQEWYDIFWHAVFNWTILSQFLSNLLDILQTCL